MSVALHPRHAGRYKDIARLLVKYGRSDLVKEAGLEDVADFSDGVDVPPKAEELTDDLERLGPTYIKLAQLLLRRNGRRRAEQVRTGARPAASSGSGSVTREH